MFNMFQAETEPSPHNLSIQYILVWRTM